MKVPKRAGRCWCGQRYSAGSMDAVRFGGIWQHLRCLPDTSDARKVAEQRKKEIANCTPDRTTIRPIYNRDLPTMLSIEANSFEDPWNKDDVLTFLRPRQNSGVVVCNDGKLAGYCFLSVGLSGDGSDGVEIRNLAVAGRFRRLGIAGTLVRRAVARLRSEKKSHLRTVVRETNFAALKFFQSQGFLAVEIDRELYGTDESAIVMRYDDPKRTQWSPSNRIARLAAKRKRGAF